MLKPTHIAETVLYVGNLPRAIRICADPVHGMGFRWCGFLTQRWRTGKILEGAERQLGLTKSNPR